MWTEEKLDGMLTEPSQALVQDVQKLKGDLMILGAGGKMGPTLATLARRAFDLAGNPGRVIAVSRFSDPIAKKLLEDHRVETISVDLMDNGSLESLPDAENIIFMAGRKFGTDGEEYLTWGMNAILPSLVIRRFPKARFVVFSSGNIYPMLPPYSGGATEQTPPSPIGEYAMSCLARERVFEYASRVYGTKVFAYRLNYAVDLRYGVLYDIARKVWEGEEVSLDTPCFNCIWQGDANEIAIRGLLMAESPVRRMNITGPEIVSVQYAAEMFGKLLGKEVRFCGTPGEKSLLNNSAQCLAAFGYPSVSVNTMIEWQAQWTLEGGRSLGKPTHFEERKGNF